MKKLDVFRKILRDTVRNTMEPEDVLLHALVLHTHRVVLRADMSLEDCRPRFGENRLELEPLSRSHLAEILASFWPEYEERGQQSYWYFLYGEITPYETFEDVSGPLRVRAGSAKNSIEAHELVEELIED